MNKSIKVMLVEDSLAYRKAVKRALGLEPEIELVSEFSTAEIALRKLQELQYPNLPDIVLLDLNLPGMSGLESIPWFRKYAPKLQIIVLTQSDNEKDILAAISSGAAGYLLKSTRLDQLQQNIETVIDGGSILDSTVARFLLDSLRSSPKVPVEENKLTSRELEVLNLISDGLVKKQVGDKLGISPKTVAIHCTHIYEKLDVPNAPAAVAKAFKKGLIPSDS